MSNEELAALIQTGETQRLGELWQQVEGLVVWKARHIMTALELRGNPCGVEFDDLMQSGFLAMVRAVETYRADAGAFSTWLVFYLQREFAEATGYRTHRSQQEPLNNAHSLDKPVGDESDGATLLELVPDPAATMEPIEDKLWRQQLHDTMESVLDSLPQEWSHILRERYYSGETLRAVVEKLGCPEGQVRSAEAKALRQLRQGKNAMRLRPFLDFDFYHSVGLGSFRRTGLSVQEQYLLRQERK